MAVAQFAAVGWRVRVFWEGDDAWFEGVVTKYAPENGYFVEYDDGEQQWEAEDPALIQFLYQTERSAQEDDEADVEPDSRPTTEPWSAPPPQSVDGYDDDQEEAYDQDEYDQDGSHEEEEQADAGKSGGASPTPEEAESDPDDDAREAYTPAPEEKPAPQASTSSRSTTRDPTKYVKSGVFFRDPETLKDTKAALLRESRELQAQYELLAEQLTQKEQLSQSLKRELHGLKAQVTVASLKAPTSDGTNKNTPQSAKDWGDLVVAQKTANRATRQRLSGFQAQLTQEQTTVQRMEKQKQRLEAKLARVPRKDLCSLVDVQMEITQVLAEKRELEAQLAKTLAAERAWKHKPAGSTSRTAATVSEEQRDAKTELEKELRTLEKTILRVQDQVDDWKLSFEKENARIVPIRARIASLQDELHKYESSQVLLRSVFMRLDRTGAGSISLDAALQAMELLAPRDAEMLSTDGMKARLAQGTPSSLDFPAFTTCFRQLFSQ